MAANVAVRSMAPLDAAGATPKASPAVPMMPGTDETFDFLTHPEELGHTTATHVPDGKRRTLSEDRYASSALQVGEPPQMGFPFMRAEHSFDAQTLANASAARDPSSICLSFAEGDIVFAHGFHESGWGDVTLLHTGKRGWIPENYFSAFADVKAVPLLSAAAGFIDAPKAYRLVTSRDSVEHTFSQAAINEIVSGVRSLLELSGTLNRDSVVAQRSLTIRRYRKALLTELAYVVSVARENRRSTDDAVIDKLVRGVYRVVMKAAALLDVWAVDEKLHSSLSVSDDESVLSQPESPVDVPKTPVLDPSSFPPGPTTPSTPVAHKLAATKQLAVHPTVPAAADRIEEVVESLCEYLRPFIDHISSLPANKNASVQILAVTRHSMLACRELLIVVEAAAGAATPSSPDLERVREQLFVRIRLLVSSARYLVAALGDTPIRIAAAAAKLSEVAAECIQLAREALMWCHAALQKMPTPLELPDREYPMFRERPLSVVSSICVDPKRNSTVSQGSQESQNSLVTQMSNASIVTEATTATGPASPTDPLRALHHELVVRGQKVRGGTLPALVVYLDSALADESVQHAFLLTFRLHTPGVDLATVCVEAKAERLATRWVESFYEEEDLPALSVLDALPALAHVLEMRRAWPVTKQLVERTLSGEEGPGNVHGSYGSSATTVVSSRRASVTRGPPRLGSQDHSSLHSLGSAFRLGGGAGTVTLGTRLLEYEPAALAAQLALMDAEVFEQLRPAELLDQRFAMTKRKLGLAPNIAKLVLMANHLSALVADSILGAETLSAKTRKNIIRLWIKTAQGCYDCGNLNGLVTIVSTLQSANIIRLRKVWGLLSTKNMAMLEQLGRLAAPDRNFYAYRQETRARRHAATIPYFGLYLSDLTFIDEGNPKRLAVRPDLDGINLDRYVKAAKAISEIQQFQRLLPIDATPNGALQGWLRQEMARCYSETNSDSDGHWRRSLFIEPR